eukprot:TRINITY_DN577_c0_g1_i2.p1 TRINITY_DN577_c0_g1~~TRINITY_DN577_c0_g1_i2.p1  ORF type:complete len:206 (-),score=37.73 TRINITY_DN577_c0_g1_i2:127-744(-)
MKYFQWSVAVSVLIISWLSFVSAYDCSCTCGDGNSTSYAVSSCRDCDGRCSVFCKDSEYTHSCESNSGSYFAFVAVFFTLAFILIIFCIVFHFRRRAYRAQKAAEEAASHPVVMQAVQQLMVDPHTGQHYLVVTGPDGQQQVQPVSTGQALSQTLQTLQSAQPEHPAVINPVPLYMSMAYPAPMVDVALQDERTPASTQARIFPQ